MSNNKKEKIKTIRLSESSWKALTQMKLDKNKDTLEDVIKEYIESEGY